MNLWGLIKNYYAHKLASEHIKNKKPVTFTVMNEILAYCNKR